MTTQSSPGLNVPSPYSPLGGIPPNASTLAAISAGILPANIVITGPAEVGLGAGANAGFGSIIPTMLAVQAAGGNNGTANIAGTGGGSPNMGAPSSGGAGNPMNGGNPGSGTQLQLNAPASSLTYPAGNPQFGG
jgi:hypothetical protein